MTPAEPVHRPSPAAPLAATPRLELLLARLRAALARQVWMHGAGSVLAALTLWLAFAFLADWALHVPPAVRWVHLLVLIALPIAVAWRELARHLRRLPDRSGLALLLGRAHPELGELLVSAVQLQRDGRPRVDSGDPELVADVLQEAERVAEGLDVRPVLAPKQPRMRLALGSALGVLLLLLAAAQPEYARIFLQRLAGGAARWPQRTHLVLTIPAGPSAERASIVESPGRIHVKLARGGDLPILVRADGKVPEEVQVHFSNGSRVVLGAGGDRTFRTILRSCQEDVELWVTGGDDRRGEPRVVVEVLEPPDVRGLAMSIEPPAYTGLPARVVHDSDVEVLAGSRLGIAMLPEPAGVRGRVRILPEDRVLELEPRTFPLRQESAQAEARTAPGLGFELVAQTSLRFRFELEDDSGLSNPDPGLFAVHVIEDHAPQVELLAPGRGDIDIVATGLLGVRARAEDDFGFAAMGFTLAPLSRAETPPASLELEMRPAPARMQGDVTAAAAVALAGRRLEVSELGTLTGGAGAPAEGEQFQIEVWARDTRPVSAEGGDAGLGRSAPVRVRIVSEEEFMRRLQDRLARVRGQAASLEELQRERLLRVRELIAALESDQPEAAGSSELAAALAGQRRVQGDAAVVGRELAAITEGVLYARIDEQAALLLEDVDRLLGASTAKGFQPEAWREALRANQARGETSGLAGQLAGMLELALSIAEEDTRLAAESLDQAGQELDLARVHARLLESAAHQVRAQQRIEELLGRLAEWDKFQAVLSLTRDILNRQRSLRERTLEHAGQK